MGLSGNADFPPAYQCTQETLDSRDILYEDFLERSSGYTNPTNVSQLADELGMSTKVDSLFGSVRRGISAGEMAPALRKRQNSALAFTHVEKGIYHFKSGNKIEAFSSLTQALKIDPENVEGLVARGALYANNGSLDKAVEDFEEALRYNPTHRNATRYLGETLVAVARRYEELKEEEEAAKTYVKILNIIPDHREATEGLRNLRGAAGIMPGLDPGKPWETRDKLRFSLSANDEEKNNRDNRGKKKRRSRSESRGGLKGVVIIHVFFFASVTSVRK